MNVCVMPQVTVDEGDGKMGWLLLRASLHDPLLVLNVESELEGGDLSSTSPCVISSFNDAVASTPR